MKFLSLLSLATALVATVSAAPLDKRASSTCLATMTGMTIMDCHCNADCTITGRCCDDFAEFAARTQQAVVTSRSGIAAVRPNGGRIPEFHKTEVVMTANTRGATKGSAFVTVRHCMFEDVAKSRKPTPNNPIVLPVEPKWEVRECTRGFDVFAVSKSGAMVPFNEAVKVPSKVRAAFGVMPNKNDIEPFPRPSDTFFYVELSGADAINAAKAAVTAEDLTTGFSAKLPKNPSGKASFDPTFGRNWAVSSPAFNLLEPHAAVIPESDVTPYDLQRNYAEVAKNANYAVSSTKVVLRKIWDGQEWFDVVNEDGQRQVMTVVAGTRGAQAEIFHSF